MMMIMGRKVSSLVVVTLVTLALVCQVAYGEEEDASSGYEATSASNKDPNSYPWVGSNPNNAYKMYWKDSYNVLASLEKFSALYIKVHGCVWSEYGLGYDYDDDGENHDGDENWYMTRTQPFRPNAAFSLYGILRNDFIANAGFNCRKGTYINSFFTYEGADAVLEQLGASTQTAFPNGGYGSAYCYEYSDDDDNYNNRNNRKLGGSNDNDDDGQSMTMGCNAKGKFVAATFDSSNCDGSMFMNITDDLKQYNRAMNGVRCAQIWNYRQAVKYQNRNSGSSGRLRRLEDQANDDAAGDDAYSSTTYGSIAETLLAQSFACDVALYPVQCPDPYGKKKLYAANLKASARRGREMRVHNWPRVLTVLAIVFMVLSCFFASVAYYVRNKKAFREGGRGAVCSQMWTDTTAAFGRLRDRYFKSKEDQKRKARKFEKKNSSSANDSATAKSKSSGKSSSKKSSKSSSSKSKKNKNLDAVAPAPAAAVATVAAVAVPHKKEKKKSREVLAPPSMRQQRQPKKKNEEESAYASTTTSAYETHTDYGDDTATSGDYYNSSTNDEYTSTDYYDYTSTEEPYTSSEPPPSPRSARRNRFNASGRKKKSGSSRWW